MLIQYSPNPHCYAILRVDHLATVEHFPYADIIEAAKKVQPKTYLVYLRNALSIPFPQDPWFPFIVVPVAPFPPPADGNFTPEMCIPIYPNTSHPAGRQPVRTELPFPYDNCFHWSNARGFNVRVRPRKNGYFDEDVAVRPHVRDEGELWRMVAVDRTKVEEADAPDEPIQTSLTARSVMGPEPDTQEDCSSIPGDELGDAQQETLENEPGANDGQSCASDEVISEFQAIVGMGVFGTRLDNKDDYPLVDVWLELAEHLEQKDIPDPRDFYVECDTLIQLVRDAQQRLDEEKKTSDHGSHCFYSHNEAEYGAGYDPVKTEGTPNEENQRRCLSASEILRKLRVRALRGLARIQHALRIPYLPIWP